MCVTTLEAVLQYHHNQLCLWIPLPLPAFAVSKKEEAVLFLDLLIP